MKRTAATLILLFFLAVTLHGKGTVELTNIRYFSYPDYTRVVLDLSSEVPIKEKTLPGKDVERLYFDLKQCAFSPSFPPDKREEIQIEAGNLKRIRLGRRQNHTLRVVFDFDHIGKYNRFYLTSPFRIVFDIFQENNHNGEGAASADPNPVTPPDKIDGTYTLPRQLGLGVHRIIIDPGHGGKDPGTCNKGLKLYEKDIVLDIAKRLKDMFEKNSKYDVLLTRDTDIYISLEERTAIANSHKGDIFLSIHLNSSPRNKTRGVETYFLSMTTDPWAIQVAAQENAVSTKSIAEMKSIIEQILKNAKKSESKILSNFVQENLVKSLQTKYSRIESLGVKKAPFYVLAGSRMPSALVEVSFLSHYQEALRLKSSRYRDLIARGLYDGVISYIKSLGKK
jgi:N-acetylmuramoyl-L-alanine amidase